MLGIHCANQKLNKLKCRNGCIVHPIAASEIMKRPLKYFKTEYLCAAADVGLECTNISFRGLCLVPSSGNKLYFTCLSLFVIIMSMLIHLTGRKLKNRIIKSVEHSARGRHRTSGVGRRGISGGLLRHRKSVFKKRRCY